MNSLKSQPVLLHILRYHVALKTVGGSTTLNEYRYLRETGKQMISQLGRGKSQTFPSSCRKQGEIFDRQHDHVQSCSGSRHTFQMFNWPSGTKAKCQTHKLQLTVRVKVEPFVGLWRWIPKFNHFSPIHSLFCVTGLTKWITRTKHNIKNSSLLRLTPTSVL